MIIYIYLRVATDGSSLELYHKTEVEEIPTAMCPYNGRMLIGIGKLLRIYDMGKKKLLRKCENKVSILFVLLISKLKLLIRIQLVVVINITLASKLFSVLI